MYNEFKIITTLNKNPCSKYDFSTRQTYLKRYGIDFPIKSLEQGDTIQIKLNKTRKWTKNSYKHVTTIVTNDEIIILNWQNISLSSKNISIIFLSIPLQKDSMKLKQNYPKTGNIIKLKTDTHCSREIFREVVFEEIILWYSKSKIIKKHEMLLMHINSIFFLWPLIYTYIMKLRQN